MVFIIRSFKRFFNFNTKNILLTCLYLIKFFELNTNELIYYFYYYQITYNLYQFAIVICCLVQTAKCVVSATARGPIFCFGFGRWVVVRRALKD